MSTPPTIVTGRGQLLPESCFPPVMFIPRLSHSLYNCRRSHGDCLRSRQGILWCLRGMGEFQLQCMEIHGPHIQICSFSHRCKLGCAAPAVNMSQLWKSLQRCEVKDVGNGSILDLLEFPFQKVWAQKLLKTQWSANHSDIWLVPPSDRQDEFPERCFLHSGLISLPMNQGWPSVGSY